MREVLTSEVLRKLLWTLVRSNGSGFRVSATLSYQTWQEKYESDKTSKSGLLGPGLGPGPGPGPEKNTQISTCDRFQYIIDVRNTRLGYLGDIWCDICDNRLENRRVLDQYALRSLITNPVQFLTITTTLPSSIQAIKYKVWLRRDWSVLRAPGMARSVHIIVCYV